MLEGVPNLAFAIGYTNASWTLKVDLVASYVSRLLRFMAEAGYASVTPALPADGMATSPIIDMTSGYFERARHLLPRQGERAPWRLRQHYFKDAALFRGPIDEKNLQFRRAAALQPTAS
jgi:monooxygenase